MSSLTSYLAATGNEFAAIAEDGIAAGDISGFIDTGSYSLNALISGSLYGGMASGKGLGLAAESSVGKTFLALAAVYQFQQLNPDGIVIMFESESAISKKMMTERGLDTSRIGVVPVVTLQEFRNQCIKIISNYEKEDVKKRKKLMFVLDSLGMLSTDKEVQDAEDGKNTKDMTRASLVRSAFRVITLRLGRSDIPMIITNHVYANITSFYGGNEVSGGGGFKYAASTILTMTKAQDKDGDAIKGAIVTCTTYKSRLTQEKLKVKTRILYKGGLDRHYGLLALAEEAGIVKKVSNKFEFLDDGVKAFEKAINNNGAKYWTETRLAALEKYVNTKFTYDSGEDEPVVVEEETDSGTDS